MESIFDIGPEVLAGAQPTRRSRTWNDNGVQYTHEELSYISPNFSANISRWPRDLPSPDSNASRNSRNRQGSLLGRVVDGITNYITSSSQPTGRDDRHRSRRQPYVESRDLPRDERRSHQRGHHSPRPSRPSRRSNQRPRSRRSTVVEDSTSSSDSDAAESHDHHDDYGTGTANRRDQQETLENAAEFHRKETELARRQLEQACRQPMGNTGYLQDLAQRVEAHERSMKAALRDLKKMAGNGHERQRSHPRPRAHQRESAPTEFQGDATFSELFHDPFISDPLFNHVTGFGHRQRSARPLFVRATRHNTGPYFAASPFAAFQDLFADFEQANRGFHQQVFGMPSATFAASFEPRPQPRRFTASFSTADPHNQRPSYSFMRSTSQPSAPPTTLLKPAEAQQLFRTYNERWNALAPAEANIPFPARGLKMSSLCSYDSLWAPSVSSPIDTWSEETLMKANTQAFFLGAVGLRPAYTETAGAKIELGIDKSSASPAQVKQLLEILKKERTRWHSDRLGKRNGGRPGANEALQQDERARAVYHGVCELIEAAQ